MVSFSFSYMVCHTRLFDFSPTCYLSMFLLPNFLWVACLAFVYFITTAWDRVHAILGHVVFYWGLDPEVIFSESHAIPEYCTTYLLNPFGKIFDIGQTICGEFWGTVLCCSIQISWSQCYAVWVIVAMEVVSWLISSWYASLSLLMDKKKLQYELR